MRLESCYININYFWNISLVMLLYSSSLCGHGFYINSNVIIVLFLFLHSLLLSITLPALEDTVNHTYSLSFLSPFPLSFSSSHPP